MTSAAFSLTAQIDFTPWQGMIDRLRGFGGTPMDAAMDELGESLVSSTKRRFHAQQSPAGVRWKPSQRVKAEGGETLIDQGRLIASLTHNVLQGQGVEWGSPLVYARVHQTGADIVIYPRSQKVYRTVEGGAGASGKGWKAFANGGRFAKASKANFSSWATISKQYTIHLPPRPYLGLDNADVTEGIGTLTRHLAAAVLDRDVRSLT